VSEVPLDIRVIAERVSEAVNKKLMELDKKYGERIEALEKRISLLEAELAAVRTGFAKDLVKSVIDAKIEDVAVSAVKSMGGVLLSELDVRVKSINDNLAQLSRGIGELKDSLSAMRSDLEKSVDVVSGSVRKSLESLQTTINNLAVAVNELRDVLRKLSETLHSVDLKVSGVFERVEDINATVKDMVVRLETSAPFRSSSEEGAG
jgi:methyl-accepting chemotaxis protein